MIFPIKKEEKWDNNFQDMKLKREMGEIPQWERLQYILMYPIQK